MSSTGALVTMASHARTRSSSAAALACTDLILNGTLERFPELRIGIVELSAVSQEKCVCTWLSGGRTRS